MAAQYEKILHSDIQSWYNSLNSIITSYGGNQISILTVPSSNKTAEAADINNYLNKMTEMQRDDYLGSESSIYPTYSVTSSGVPINYDIAELLANSTGSSYLGRIRCRNMVTNSQGTHSSGKHSSGKESNGKHSSGQESNGTYENGGDSYGLHCNGSYSGKSTYCVQGWGGVCSSSWQGIGVHGNGKKGNSTNDYGSHSNGTNSNESKSNQNKSNGSKNNESKSNGSMYDILCNHITNYN